MSKNLKTIFLITTVYSDRRGSNRCWGWYPTKDAAWEDLKANTDMFCENGSYDYLVIEECGPGIMALIDSPSTPEWVHAKFDRTTHTYDLQVVPLPTFAEGIICWGMG